MKKLLLVLGIALMGLSCKKDDVQPGHTYTLNCEEIPPSNGFITSLQISYTDTHGNQQSIALDPQAQTYSVSDVDDTKPFHKRWYCHRYPTE